MNKIYFFANDRTYVPAGTFTYNYAKLKNEYLKILSLKLS